MLENLLNELSPYSEYDRDSYRRLEFEKIEVVTKKGRDGGAALIDGRWIPKSQLKCGVDGELYVSNWFYDKNFPA